MYVVVFTACARKEPEGQESQVIMQVFCTAQSPIFLQSSSVTDCQVRYAVTI